MTLTSCIKEDRSGRPGWIIQFPYDPGFLENFKAEIHKRHREWIKESKSWWVDILCEEELDKLFDNFEALAMPQGMRL